MLKYLKTFLKKNNKRNKKARLKSSGFFFVFIASNFQILVTFVRKYGILKR